jgi:hypothetical protein
MTYSITVNISESNTANDHAVVALSTVVPQLETAVVVHVRIVILAVTEKQRLVSTRHGSGEEKPYPSRSASLIRL